MSQHLHLVSPSKSAFKPASSECAERIAAELRAEAYDQIAQILKLRRDFIAQRNLCLRQIATTKSLLAALDVYTGDFDEKLPGWKVIDDPFLDCTPEYRRQLDSVAGFRR